MEITLEHSRQTCGPGESLRLRRAPASFVGSSGPSRVAASGASANPRPVSTFSSSHPRLNVDETFLLQLQKTQNTSPDRTRGILSSHLTTELSCKHTGGRHGEPQMSCRQVTRIACCVHKHAAPRPDNLSVDLLASCHLSDVELLCDFVSTIILFDDRAAL